jgi:prepilin-type N-terminal cleavage/methylation domain-containing protein
MKKNKGFALSEVLLAILLIGIVISSTIYGLVSAQMFTAKARHHYSAVSIARDTAERIMAGETVAGGDVVIEAAPDAADNLVGNLAITADPAGVDNTWQITVSWTEEMWGTTNESETIVMFYE